jgi:hypothetical protein
MTGKPSEQADQEALNRLLVALLDGMALPYAIGGSMAAMAYSEPRYTKDIDLMFDAELSQLGELVEAIESLQVYVDPLDTILEFNLPRQMPISVVDGTTGVRADLYLARPSGLDQSAMSRRRKQMMYDDPPLEAWYLAPEDVILYKLDYFRQSEGVSQKHPIDISKMLAVVGDQLDLAYLEHWAREIGVLNLWQALWDEFRR